MQHLISLSLQDMINLSQPGYVPEGYRAFVIKHPLKEPTHDPGDLATYRLISKLPLLSKVLDKVVANL